MSIRVCPYCGATIAHGANQCYRCRWTATAPSSPRRASGPVVCLVIMVLLLMLSASCAYGAYTAKFGDEYGYGQSALIESGIILLAIVWLGAGLALRSNSSKTRKIAIFRASAGSAVAALALVLAVAHISSVGSKDSDWLRPLMLAVSGIGLLATSFRALRTRP